MLLVVKRGFGFCCPLSSLFRVAFALARRSLSDVMKQGYCRLACLYLDLGFEFKAGRKELDLMQIRCFRIRSCGTGGAWGSGSVSVTFFASPSLRASFAEAFVSLELAALESDSPALAACSECASVLDAGGDPAVPPQIFSSD